MTALLILNCYTYWHNSVSIVLCILDVELLLRFTIEGRIVYNFFSSLDVDIEKDWNSVWKFPVMRKSLYRPRCVIHSCVFGLWLFCLFNFRFCVKNDESSLKHGTGWYRCTKRRIQNSMRNSKKFGTIIKVIFIFKAEKILLEK